MTTPAPTPAEVWGTFAGSIDQVAVQRILTTIATASAAAALGNIRHAHLLFQSSGGTVVDGICLFNVFRALPFDLTLYNAGGVYSIATLAYLGAKKRKTSAYASFLIHRTRTGSNQPTTASQLKAVTEGLLADDQRTESILRQHLTLSDEEWKHLDYNDLQISAARAVEIGLAHEIGEFNPPLGSQLFNVPA
jgi:ATP-dependent Clp protease protease subunit